MHRVLDYIGLLGRRVRIDSVTRHDTSTLLDAST
jgi:hypothetical protein